MTWALLGLGVPLLVAWCLFRAIEADERREAERRRAVTHAKIQVLQRQQAAHPCAPHGHTYRVQAWTCNGCGEAVTVDDADVRAWLA